MALDLASMPTSMVVRLSGVARKVCAMVVLVCIFHQLLLLRSFSGDLITPTSNDEPRGAFKDQLRVRTRIGREREERERLDEGNITPLNTDTSADTPEKLPSVVHVSSDEFSLETTNKTNFSRSDSNKNHVIQTSHDNGIERAFVVICMGDSAIRSNYVERFVWSARKIGEYTGWIVLLTDAPEDRYISLTQNEWGGIDNERFAIVRPQEQDYVRSYEKGPAMVYKQFKTFVLDYLSQDSRLDNVELVYYLDVDIIFGNRVAPLFHELETKYRIGRSSEGSGTNSNVAKMWMFEGNSKRSKIQGGQMILDRRTSQPCLKRFRSLMDPKSSTIDQVHLMQMLKDQRKAKTSGDFSSLECEIVVMPQEEQYIVFPSETEIRNITHRDGPTPVLNHLKNTGGDLKHSSDQEIETYLRYMFRFQTEEQDALGITKKMYLDQGQRAKKPKRGQRTQEIASRQANGGDDERKDDVPIDSGSSTIQAPNWKHPLDSPIVDDDDHVPLNPPDLITRHSIRNNNVTSGDGIERAMFIISMGKKAADMSTVERFIYSARNRGQYFGWIVVLTDAPKDRYASISDWSDKVIIMEPKPEDVKSHYKVPNMVYKRFKTFAIDYMDRDSRLDKVELVYYLDVDIVFGDRMEKAFHGLETMYGIGPLGANTTNYKDSIAKGKMWMFRGNSKKWQLQGGQMILERRGSKPCLERWRKGFDQEKVKEYGKDQWLLMAMKEEQDIAFESAANNTLPTNHSRLECEIIKMEQEPYIEFPLVRTIKRRSQAIRKNPHQTYDYSPIVHIRNDGGTASMKNGNIRPFVRDLLGFRDGQKDPLKLLKKVQMDTS